MAEGSALGKKLSQRFVPGMEIEDVLRATKEVNALGMSVSIDNLGENVNNADEARHSAKEWLVDRRHPRCRRRFQSVRQPSSLLASSSLLQLLDNSLVMQASTLKL